MRLVSAVYICIIITARYLLATRVEETKTHNVVTTRYSWWHSCNVLQFNRKHGGLKTAIIMTNMPMCRLKSVMRKVGRTRNYDCFFLKIVMLASCRSLEQRLQYCWASGDLSSYNCMSAWFVLSHGRYKHTVSVYRSVCWASKTCRSLTASCPPNYPARSSESQSLKERSQVK